jgi:hypothetical protein
MHRLEGILRDLRASAPERAHRCVYDAIVVAALAGEIEVASGMLDSLLALPQVKSVPHALAPHALDVLCHVAGFGDRLASSRSLQANVLQGPLTARVAAIEQRMRAQLAQNTYAGSPPSDDSWKTRPAPWFAIGCRRP